MIQVYASPVRIVQQYEQQRDSNDARAARQQHDSNAATAKQRRADRSTATQQRSEQPTTTTQQQRKDSDRRKPTSIQQITSRCLTVATIRVY
jgi:hypothetical protein